MMEEMEGSDGQEEKAPWHSNYYFTVRIGALIVTFVMGLTLMNIFIAVLVISYENALANANEMFMRTRAVVIVDQYLMKIGFAAFSKLWKKGKHTSSLLEEDQGDWSLNNFEKKSGDVGIHVASAHLWITSSKYAWQIKAQDRAGTLEEYEHIFF